MTKQIEIYFADLTEQKQKEVLDAYGLQSADEENFDVAPLSILEVEEAN